MFYVLLCFKFYIVLQCFLLAIAIYPCCLLCSVAQLQHVTLMFIAVSTSVVGNHNRLSMRSERCQGSKQSAFQQCRYYQKYMDQYGAQGKGSGYSKYYQKYMSEAFLQVGRKIKLTFIAILRNQRSKQKSSGQ